MELHMMCTTKIIILKVCLLISNCVESARILAMLPTPSISHMIIYHPILKELSLRGHQVVAILPDPINNETLTNLTEISVHDVAYDVWRTSDILAKTGIKSESSFRSFSNLYKILLKICDIELSHPQVKQLIQANTKFDLVINEWLMYPSTFAFGEYFNCPIVGIASMPLFITGYDTIGVPTHPAFAMDFWTLSGTDLSLWERIINTLHSIWFRLYYHLIVLPDHDRIVKKHFGSNIKYVGDIERDVQLILVNTNPIFHMSRPMPPNCIEIGGIHKKIDTDAFKSKHIQHFLDRADQGVIYFSLGSNVKSSSLPQHLVDIFLQTFSQLPFCVLWKWEEDSFPSGSVTINNIHLEKWLPQQDILDHKNVKLFITQGGLQSIEESIRSGVPMIGIPFAGDQHHNAARIVSLQIGKQIFLEELSVDILNQTIFEVIHNKKYKEHIVEISKILWDQPMPPLERAIWWIEYVLRHKGAKALRSGNADLPWYKYLLIDVIAVFLLSVCALAFVMKISFLLFYKKFFGHINSKIKTN